MLSLWKLQVPFVGASWVEHHHSTGRKVSLGKSGREQAVFASFSFWLGRVWEQHRACPPGSTK